MVFDKTRPKPSWLNTEYAVPGSIRGLNRSRALWQAQPPWADVKLMRRIYRQAKALRDEGKAVEVDHILPLKHPSFCGLHVPWNLRIVASNVNRRHSNTMHPEHPQRDLFERWHAPEYFELKPCK